MEALNIPKVVQLHNCLTQWRKEGAVGSATLVRHAIFVTSVALLLYKIDAHPFHVDHSNSELEQMDIESLLHVERDLRGQNMLVQKHLADLYQRQAQMINKQQSMEKAYKKLKSGRDWEKRQTAKRQKELGIAMAHMQTRKEQVETMNAHADSVRREIHEMEQKLKSLRAENMEVQARYAHPTMIDILDAKIQFWGPTPHRILDKTLQTLVLPLLSSGSDRAMQFRWRVQRTSQFSPFIATLAIYIFSLYILHAAYCRYTRAKSTLTLFRVLFLADLWISAFWFLVALCDILLVADPFDVARAKFERFLVAFQLITAAIFAVYVGLRCMSTVSTLDGVECIELIAYICVLQHYAQNTWTPSLTDEPLLTSVTAYLVYGCTHLCFAARRARTEVFGKSPAWFSDDGCPAESPEGIDKNDSHGGVSGNFHEDGINQSSTHEQPGCMEGGENLFHDTALAISEKVGDFLRKIFPSIYKRYKSRIRRNRPRKQRA